MISNDYPIRRLDERIDAMTIKAGTSGITQIEYRSGIPVTAVTNLTLGTATTDIPVTWDNPFPDAAYIITKPQIEITTIALLGKADAKVKAQTDNGCVVTVTTTTLLAAGQLNLSVFAYRKS